MDITLHICFRVNQHQEPSCCCCKLHNGSLSLFLSMINQAKIMTARIMNNDNEVDSALRLLSGPPPPTSLSLSPSPFIIPLPPLPCHPSLVRSVICTLSASLVNPLSPLYPTMTIAISPISPVPLCPMSPVTPSVNAKRHQHISDSHQQRIRSERISSRCRISDSLNQSHSILSTNALTLDRPSAIGRRGSGDSAEIQY